MKSFTKTEHLYLVLSILTLGSILADSYRNPHTIKQYFNIESTSILVTFIIITLILRLLIRYKIPKIITTINDKLILPLTSITSLVLSYFDFIYYENYIFRNFAINVHQISYLALASLILLLMSRNVSWWKQNWQKICFYGLPTLFLILLTVRLWSFEYFKNMVRDDNLIEWIQFGTVLSTSFFAILTSLALNKRKSLLSLLFFLFALCTFFIAGEEISWGQRIIGFETPPILAEQNLQKETTIHNLAIFREPTWTAYFVLSILGSFSWGIILLSPKHLRNIMKFFIPPWFASIYFIFAFFYYLIASPFPFISTYYTEWSEIAELMLYLGILFTMVNSYITVKNQS
jgi:hypothetical protein